MYRVKRANPGQEMSAFLRVPKTGWVTSQSATRISWEISDEKDYKRNSYFIGIRAQLVGIATPGAPTDADADADADGDAGRQGVGASWTDWTCLGRAKGDMKDLTFMWMDTASAQMLLDLCLPSGELLDASASSRRDVAVREAGASE